MCLIPKNLLELGIIIEFKKVDEGEDLEKGADEALKQIEEKQYAAELLSRGRKRLTNPSFSI